MESEPGNPVYLNDVVCSGMVLAAGPGDGPDGVILVVWDRSPGQVFTIWESWDGGTWQVRDRALGEHPIELPLAVVLAQQLLRRVSCGQDDGGSIRVCLSDPTLRVIDSRDSEVQC
jgi:hypothetical protein